LPTDIDAVKDESNPLVATACSKAALASAIRLAGWSIFATAATAEGTRFIWKQERHSTGRPCVGLNGTVVSIPQAEHWVRVSVRDKGRAAAATPGLVDRPRPARLALHSLQRFGSFLNCLSKKKSCSPAVKTNSLPQSQHLRSLSMNSIAPSPIVRDQDEAPPKIVTQSFECGFKPRFAYRLHVDNRARWILRAM
jgi:hypothetical protein